MSVMDFCGRPRLLSIMRDVSQRIRTEKILSQQIQDQMREQVTLLAISHALASTLEIQPGMILDQLREIIEYTHCALFALEDSALVTMATRGTPQLEGSEPFRIHLQGEKTLAEQKLVMVEDISGEIVHLLDKVKLDRGVTA